MPRLTRRKFFAYGAGFGCLALGNDASRLAPPPTRVGMVGLGERGRSHLRALRSLRSAHVAAICDVNPGRMAAAVRSLTAGTPPAAHTDFRQLLDCPDIDLVSISVPPSERMRIIQAAAQAGKNMVVEQSAAATLSEALQLQNLATRFSVSIEHIPSDPEWDREELVALLSIGKLGRVQRVEIHEVRAEPTGLSAPLVDALEVAAQLLTARMPRRSVALAASGMRAGWNASAEIELETPAGAGYLASHVTHQPLPKGLERSIYFSVQGSHGSARTVIECWRHESTTNQPSVQWARALWAANICNRRRWPEATRRTAATCAILEILKPKETNS